MSATTLGALRGGWGAVLMARPGALVAAASGRPPSRDAVAVARVLAGRQLAQAAVTLIRPSPWVLGLGAVADGLHALSGIGLAAVSGRWRRTALLDATLATAFAAAGWRSGRRARPMKETT